MLPLYRAAPTSLPPVQSVGPPRVGVGSFTGRRVVIASLLDISWRRTCSLSGAAARGAALQGLGSRGCFWLVGEFSSPGYTLISVSFLEAICFCSQHHLARCITATRYQHYPHRTLGHHILPPPTCHHHHHTYTHYNHSLRLPPHHHQYITSLITIHHLFPLHQLSIITRIITTHTSPLVHSPSSPLLLTAAITNHHKSPQIIVFPWRWIKMCFELS